MDKHHPPSFNLNPTIYLPSTSSHPRNIHLRTIADAPIEIHIRSPYLIFFHFQLFPAPPRCRRVVVRGRFDAAAATRPRGSLRTGRRGAQLLAGRKVNGVAGDVLFTALLQSRGALVVAPSPLLAPRLVRNFAPSLSPLSLSLSPLSIYPRADPVGSSASSPQTRFKSRDE